MVGVRGVSFNTLRTSDGKVMLEWQAIDPVNRQATKYITIHASFEELSKKLEEILKDGRVL